MESGWANSGRDEFDEVFHGLHEYLTVELISTERSKFMTCPRGETLACVRDRNTGPYDFLPVTDGQSSDRIIGLLHAAPLMEGASHRETVEEHFKPLSEDFLIGADSSILDFIKDADEKPCRLVVSRGSITGLVTLSDLQKLPVRAALFALITGFEITMYDAIKKKYPDDEIWKSKLSNKKKRRINRSVNHSKNENIHIDQLLHTYISDKTYIILESFEFKNNNEISKKIDSINNLRNDVAHANEYATSPDKAKDVCKTVRSIIEIRDYISKI